MHALQKWNRCPCDGTSSAAAIAVVLAAMKTDSVGLFTPVLTSSVANRGVDAVATGVGGFTHTGDGFAFSATERAVEPISVKKLAVFGGRVAVLIAALEMSGRHRATAITRVLTHA